MLSGFDAHVVKQFREADADQVEWWQPSGSSLALRMDGYSTLLDPSIAREHLQWLLEHLLEHRASPQGGGTLMLSPMHPAAV